MEGWAVVFLGIWQMWIQHQLVSSVINSEGNKCIMTLLWVFILGMCFKACKLKMIASKNEQRELFALRA